MGFSTPRALVAPDFEIWFQSLEGIFGFFNRGRNNVVPDDIGVSIPRRDFWVFQQIYEFGMQRQRKFQSLEGIFGFFNEIGSRIFPHVEKVSIPRRDFWVFQLAVARSEFRMAVRFSGFNP
ncbi:hypothetical protein CKA32_000701 [Geitlerinema sp. FC II]|nr:hypothetical protein CKA32_000701 [Geitlerinema sp. FC II]